MERVKERNEKDDAGRKKRAAEIFPGNNFDEWDELRSWQLLLVFMCKGLKAKRAKKDFIKTKGVM